MITFVPSALRRKKYLDPLLEDEKKRLAQERLNVQIGRYKSITEAMRGSFARLLKNADVPAPDIPSLEMVQDDGTDSLYKNVEVVTHVNRILQQALSIVQDAERIIPTLETGKQYPTALLQSVDILKKELQSAYINRNRIEHEIAAIDKAVILLQAELATITKDKNSFTKAEISKKNELSRGISRQSTQRREQSAALARIEASIQSLERTIAEKQHETIARPSVEIVPPVFQLSPHILEAIQQVRDRLKTINMIKSDRQFDEQREEDEMKAIHILASKLFKELQNAAEESHRGAADMRKEYNVPTKSSVAAVLLQHLHDDQRVLREVSAKLFTSAMQSCNKSFSLMNDVKRIGSRDIISKAQKARIMKDADRSLKDLLIALSVADHMTETQNMRMIGGRLRDSCVKLHSFFYEDIPSQSLTRYSIQPVFEKLPLVERTLYAFTRNVRSFAEMLIEMGKMPFKSSSSLEVH